MLGIGQRRIGSDLAALVELGIAVVGGISGAAVSVVPVAEVLLRLLEVLDDGGGYGMSFTPAPYTSRVQPRVPGSACGVRSSKK